MKRPKKSELWQDLHQHADSVYPIDFHHIKSNSLNHPKRSISACGIDIDYSYQHVTDQTLTTLINLANACNLQEKIIELLSGAEVNLSEARPALHTALRIIEPASIIIDGKNIMLDVFSARDEIKFISEKIRSKQWLGFAGKPIVDIVHIGIGGSDLGPRFCINALSNYLNPDLNYHFISDIDPDVFNNTVSKLKAETTLFIVASKSFTTEETLFNANKAKDWIGSGDRIEKHIIAVTANIKKAREFGVKVILPIWDWVGGRYSLCSAINLITAIAIGYEGFNQLLVGANNMDNHFRDTPYSQNLPVMLALLGIWNNNFLNIHNLLILTYSKSFEQIVSYIQQLDMESNGKSIDNQYNFVPYATGPLVWGGSGSQAQHSYYQLLCQGTHKVAVDLITLKNLDGYMINDMYKDKVRVLTQGVKNSSHPSGFIRGEIPVNQIRLTDCTPFRIGAFAALYEHKVFTQSVIWDINPFDQPGVESAKRNRALSRKSNNNYTHT